MSFLQGSQVDGTVTPPEFIFTQLDGADSDNEDDTKGKEEKDAESSKEESGEKAAEEDSKDDQKKADTEEEKKYSLEIQAS